DHGVPRRRARQPQPHDRGDERAPAADGADRARRQLQPRPADLVPDGRGRPGPALPAGSVKAVLLLGPTASGKTAVALELSRRFPFEIVSVDSAQVYRGMDVGTAKPSLSERTSVAHHLVDLVDTDHSYSTGRWRNDAIQAIADILNKEKIPLLVGGTMVHCRALAA